MSLYSTNLKLLVVSPHPKKADKSALDSKVSRLQFDSATEQLNTMFHELLNKVTDQEQDWHKVIDKLSTEMECKVERDHLFKHNGCGGISVS